MYINVIVIVLVHIGKRPLSSMTPAIFTDSMGRVKLVIGTAGGTNIPTATALVRFANSSNILLWILISKD